MLAGAALVVRPDDGLRHPWEEKNSRLPSERLTQRIAFPAPAPHIAPMRPLLSLLVVSASLLACGGGDSGLPNTGRLGNNIITVQALVWHAWVNAYDPNNPEGCPDLLALGEFSAAPGPFPTDVAIPLVEVYWDGALLWSGPVRNDSGLLDAENLHAVAAACGLKPLPAAGTPLTVRFVMTGGGEVTSITTSPLPLTFVY